MSTHNLCFGAKIRKKCIYTPVNPIKVGCKGVFVSQTCFRDVFLTCQGSFSCRVNYIFP